MDISAFPSAKAVTYPGAKPGNFVGFYIVGCVSYRYSFGTEIHQTYFAYHIVHPIGIGPKGKWMTLPNGQTLTVGFEIGINVDKKDVTFWQEPFARHDAT